MGARGGLVAGAMVLAAVGAACSSSHPGASRGGGPAPVTGGPATTATGGTAGGGGRSTFAGNSSVLGSTANGPAWMLEQFSVQALLDAGLSTQTLEALFDRPQAIIISKLGDQIPDPLLPHATYALTFANFATLQAAVDGGRVPSMVSYVVFDDEKWPATPPEEQRDPIGYASRAEAVAHAHGLGLIFTPAANLAEVLSPSYTEATKYDGYLGLGLPKSGAGISDVYEIQGQQDEGRPSFLSFVNQAVGQVRSANPSAAVFLGLTTKAPGQAVTAALLESDFEATRSEVTGYWLNIPSPHGPEDPGVAVQFLQSVAGS
jgi:hypothetical protein